MERSKERKVKKKNPNKNQKLTVKKKKKEVPGTEVEIGEDSFIKYQ